MARCSERKKDGRSSRELNGMPSEAFDITGRQVGYESRQSSGVSYASTMDHLHGMGCMESQ